MGQGNTHHIEGSDGRRFTFPIMVTTLRKESRFDCQHARVARTARTLGGSARGIDVMAAAWRARRHGVRRSGRCTSER